MEVFDADLFGYWVQLRTYTHRRGATWLRALKYVWKTIFDRDTTVPKGSISNIVR